MEEIQFQTCLNSFITDLDLANVGTGGNYICGSPPDPLWLRRWCAIRYALTQDSIVPAIIIKRH